MPAFRYVGNDGRVFPHVSLTVAPGDVVEADANPDARYFVPDEGPAASSEDDD